MDATDWLQLAPFPHCFAASKSPTVTNCNQHAERCVMFQGEEMDISENRSSSISQQQYRKSLVPAWMKVFGWFFICFAALVTFGFLMATLNPEIPFSLNIFGIFYTGTARNVIPFSLFFLTVLTAYVGYGLLSGKSWALTASLVVGFLNLATTLVGKAIFSAHYFPFEPFVILVYLFVLFKLKRRWQHEP